MKPSLWKNYYDVVILPPRALRDYAIKLSKNFFEKYHSRWTLGKKAYLPHLSLYHIPVKQKQFPIFMTDLKKAVAGQKVGYLKTAAIDYHFLMLETEKPLWLKKLQAKIVKKTVKYIDWDYGVERFWHIERFPRHMQKACRRYLKEYGTPLIGANFRPHITLTSFDGKAPTFKPIRVKKFAFKPNALYVCELGEDHTCQKIVARINF